MMSLGKIIRNFSTLVSSYAIERALYLVLIVVLARWGGTELLGKYAFTFAMTGFLGTLTNLGIGSLLLRDVAKHKDKVGQYIWNSAGIRLATLACTGFSAVLLTHYMGKGHDVVISMYAALVVYFLNNMRAILSNVLLAFERAGVVSSISITQNLISISIAIYMILTRPHLFNIVLGFVVGSVVGFLLTVWFSREYVFPRSRISVDFCRIILSRSFPYVAGTVYSSLYMYLPILMISYFSGDVLAGFYRSALAITNVYGSVTSLFMVSSVPVLTGVLDDRKKASGLLSSIRRVVFYIGVPMLALIFVFAGQILTLVYGPQFARSTDALRILVISEVVSLVMFPRFLAISSGGLQRMYMTIFGFASIAYITFSLILVPHYTLEGAAFSVLLTSIIILILLEWNKHAYLRDK